MNLHALKIFVTVAKLGGITAAANHLLLSQPAVTIQIRNLESEMGVKLIEGKGRGIQLTNEGVILYEQGQRLFQLEAQIEQRFSQHLNHNKQINIAASYISSSYVLPNMIAQYKAQHPEVNFSISLSNVQKVAERVRNFEADFGLVVQSEIGHEELNFEPYLNVPFWFVVHRMHPLANKTVEMHQLTTEEFIYREKGSSTRDLLQAVFYANNCPLPKRAVEIQGVQESVKLVEAGFGMTLAPALSVKDSIENGKLARVYVPQVEIEQTLYICSRKLDQQEHPFIQFMKQQDE